MGAQGAISQPSFAAGEISPALYGRTDLAKYRVGLAQARNFFIMPYGGAATRPGTAIVGRCKQPYPVKPRNIPFEYNTEQAYILEFGQLYMRVIKDGGYVLNASKAVTAATVANPGVFTVASHGYAVGDWLFPDGMTGNWSVLNGTPGYAWIVATTPTGNTFTATDLDGNPVNTAALGAYPGGATVARFFTLTTTYQAADLPLLKYVQSADVMTLTHPDYDPRYLTRSAHDNWTLTTITFQAAVQAPGSIMGAPVPGGGADLDYYYVATALTDAPAEESVPTGAAVVTNDALNQDTGINNTITLTAPGSGPAPDRYNIYRSKGVASGQPAPTSFGYIGQTTSLQFVDANFDPDFSLTPPEHAAPVGPSNPPSCSTYFQGRQWFGGSLLFPQTMWATQSDNFTNMDVHSPLRDSDGITVTLVSRQVNAIKHLVATTSLLAMTSGGSWLVAAGSQSDAITPTNISAKPQSFNGCSDVPPLTIADMVLYVQYLGSKVRGIGYDFYQNIFRGNDLSILSNHFFYGFRVQEWTYCEEPNYQVLAVRDDGAMLAFTYLKEQDVYAWTKYDTLGGGTDKYRSVASIPEGQENVPYMVIERTVPSVNGGNPVFYQERQASRNFYVNGVPDVRLAWCVDSGRQYTGSGQTVLSGLQHLEGSTVSLLVNGSTQEPRVVEDGAITLDAPLEVDQIATVGLGYVCDMTTLRLDFDSMAGKRKKISRLNMTVQDTRGLKISPARTKANGDVVFDQFVEVKERTNQPYAEPVELITGIETLLIRPQWQIEGQVKVRQEYPLPASVLALTPWLEVGDDGG